MGGQVESKAGGRFSGSGPFLLVWSSQTVSLVGSSAVRFAFIVDVWSAGQRATAVTLLSLCSLLPQALLSPVAGAVVDRISKRAALQVADAGGLVAVGVLAVFHYCGGLHSWEIYPATFVLGSCAAFQFPALSSAVPLLVRRDQFGRANGLLAGAKSTAGICGPALGGVMLALTGIGPLLLLDVVSYAFALTGSRVVRLNGDRVAATGAVVRRRITAEAVHGMRYLLQRPPLRALILNFCVVNLVMVFGFALIAPMVLLKSGEASLAAVNTAIGVGGVGGGLLMAAWGGPRDRGRGMMLGVAGMCLSALVAMSLVDTVVGWCAAVLVGALLMTVVNASMQAIVQTKVPPQWQGRVFGAVMFLSQISVPVATAASGPLADEVFEPAARHGAGLFAVLGPLVGHRPGSGMAGMLLLAGAVGTAVALWGLASRNIRDIDTLLPDAPDPDDTPDTDTDPDSGGGGGGGADPDDGAAGPAGRADSDTTGGADPVAARADDDPTPVSGKRLGPAVAARALRAVGSPPSPGACGAGALAGSGVVAGAVDEGGERDALCA
ncbi:MFS transporter [Streptacidiphilus sp. PB12-B1b]|uniref:MFS transporter n=1 Tax=Streptacidiphilus sp. PB12-B1b TaxID=2705012 RepID=UPI0015FB71E0|nr:MFS transporter [Streptacidiphilus sp. PB12-B1b]QMU77311.1 MFS transporter [Streptacidiphilus sp. PB12-B1b]